MCVPGYHAVSLESKVNIFPRHWYMEGEQTKVFNWILKLQTKDNSSPSTNRVCGHYRRGGLCSELPFMGQNGESFCLIRSCSGKFDPSVHYIVRQSFACNTTFTLQRSLYIHLSPMIYTGYLGKKLFCVISNLAV